MASHEFIKRHRRLPSEDSFARRLGDGAYIWAVWAGNFLWDSVEDGCCRVADRLRRRRS